MTQLLDASRYDPDGAVDLRGYTGSMAVYVAAVGGLLLLGRGTGRSLPERYSLTDLTLGGIATHKLTRLLSRSSVASPLRAPFTEFDAAAGSGEHVESSRGEHGVRHTVGELLTCPFCLGVWVGTAYVAGMAFAPRPTRAAAAVLTVVGASDALQHGYSRLRGD
ncbi:DUF1360 domain-containing protein [Nocardioides sp. zg-1228]|uniref:DUF1360 domain-containing protein n=1 Tax=Nocardioides sp. zg-1228 TaxID=2763008 RepID=UPI001642E5AF|nr:DUF1360 domain-containing protein [Nocardioides sp. zg-1228]MBC2931954.1 DUF1360 domain-containing protein [Nocardioides sp. zg-1228]QSF57509.1 DUF1360 domain-containing protein [Nocardioides sp. zg-1228]